ncbi:hypothetical protein QC764_103540 [Podospora pseudoanserina]|uniref:SprT-like domain-containing protein n=1 Tax=Podospora pseudoanserina TaxID=2609844 RepID=A0ABR0IKQ3_9PEZI|nr:hypothetical protein QC764_103540 [Podospora pseudoanserina]
MARPGGGDEHPPFPFPGGLYYPAKRRTIDIDADDYDDLYREQSRVKRPRYIQYAQYADTVAYQLAVEPNDHITNNLNLVGAAGAGGGGGERVADLPLLSHPHPHHPYSPPGDPRPHHTHIRSRPSLSPNRSVSAPAPMERTVSGLSIRPDPTESHDRCGSMELLEDAAAAQRVREHLANFTRRNPDSKHERILRSIINPRGRHSELQPLDNDSLESIFSAANEIFFNGRLSQRVRWDWSDESSTRYDCRVIGTTALRKKIDKGGRGFETLIVLSSTILRDKRYNCRRLLISTFLHELIHCYLFICCGFRARWEGGHTRGFREIAEIVDEWAGEGSRLYLGRVEADLELFRVEGSEEAADGYFAHRRGRQGSQYPCSGMPEQHQESYGGTQEVVKFQGGHDFVQIFPEDHNRGRSIGRSPSRRTDSSNVWWRQQRTVRPSPLFITYGAGSGGVSYGADEDEYIYPS